MTISNKIESRLVMAIAIIVSMLHPYSPVAAAPNLAEEAYYEIEENVFNPTRINEALKKLTRARRQNPNDPWVYLTASLATLVSGYQIGDWYSMQTFTDGTVDNALKLAGKARALDPQNAQCHAHFARILIVKGEYRKAWDVLNEAHKMDTQSFYPFYFRGILAEKMRDATRANDYFREAEKRITRAYQASMVDIHRQNVAKISRDLDEQERLLKDNIAKNPDKSLYYGNYASFLMSQKRYDEAILYWKKVIALGPYPHALDELKNAENLRQAERSVESRQ